MVGISYETQAITATSGVDYLPASASVQLEDGQEQVTVNITLVDDSEREFAEQFSVTLVNPTGLWPFALAAYLDVLNVVSVSLVATKAQFSCMLCTMHPQGQSTATVLEQRKLTSGLAEQHKLTSV